MNLDELISKYIDGELTEYEDDFLRQRISADKSARNKFDAAINLNIAFKEDAMSIAPPIDLVNRTEDLVLMKILAQAPEERRRRAFAWSNASMLAASIIALMFLMVFQISDFTFRNKSINNQSEIANLSNTGNEIENLKLNDNSKPKTKSPNFNKKVFSTNKKVFSTNKNYQKISANLSSGVISTNNDNEIIENDNNETIENNFTSNNQIENKINRTANTFVNPIIPVNIITPNSSESDYLTFNKSNINSLVTTTNNFIDYQNYINNEFQSNVNNNNDVQVASFFGTDIVKTGANAYYSVISHFSQSVAYAVNEKERFGVELGYTEYTYDEKAVVNVKHKIGSLISGVESNETGYGFTINYQHPIVLKNSKQMIWASVFYENSFLTTNTWALIARVGAGATNEGPLGYSRVYTKYNLFNRFNLILGAEGRLYSAKLPKFVGDNNKFQASCSLIYGFQFKF